MAKTFSLVFFGEELSLLQQFSGVGGVPLTKKVYLVEHIQLKLNKTKLNKTKIIVDRHQLQTANYLQTIYKLFTNYLQTIYKLFTNYLQTVLGFGGLETKFSLISRELKIKLREDVHELFLDNRYLK